MAAENFLSTFAAKEAKRFKLKVGVFIVVIKHEGILCNNEPDRCDELAFFPLKGLPIATDGFIFHALQCIQKGEFFSEFGFGENL